MRIEVTTRRLPHTNPDMDVSPRLPSFSQASAAGPLSKARITSASWTSVQGGQDGADVGFVGDLDSPLVAKVRTASGHCRLPSTDSGIQADAGWDSLKRPGHSSRTALDVGAVAGGVPSVRTVAGDRRWGRGPEGEGEGGATGSAVSSKETKQDAVKTPSSTSATISLVASSPIHVAHHETTVLTPASKLSSLSSDSSHVSKAVESINGRGVSSDQSFVPVPSPRRVMSPDRNAGRLNLVSASTPVIPSPSPQGTGSQSSQWVMGGRNLFPSQSRTSLDISPPRTASNDGVLRVTQPGSPPIQNVPQSVPLLLHPVQVQHLHAPSSAYHHGRPRVNPVTTRFLGTVAHPVHKLHIEVVENTESGTVVIKEGSSLQEASMNPSLASIKNLAGGLPRSVISPTPARRSCKGRSPKLPPKHQSGVVHNIPIKHLDTCSACLKPEPIKNDLANGGPARRPLVVGGNASEISFNNNQDSTGVGQEREPGRVILKMVEKETAGEVLDPMLKSANGQPPRLDSRNDVPWSERRSRIDSALSWLRNELESLRAMDATLVTQFRRCQETIETLKQQRDAVWDGEGSDWGWGYGCGGDGSEFDEDEEAWEDWEIAEFEKKWAEDPNAKEIDIILPPTKTTSPSGVSCATELNTTTASSDTTNNQSDSSPVIKQDVEVTV
ncbi:uncharacterized protein LOC112562427 isoform X3 [Pomacea canaliculata]|nr:uncharacterized protein LOC112562427 isoform X3 [Pomacea canaliculata]XP_025091477.1 uncharacterized protein LOC112562427 isoform X3 [Pomacea canaliculata]